MHPMNQLFKILLQLLSLAKVNYIQAKTMKQNKLIFFYFLKLINKKNL